MGGRFKMWTMLLLAVLLPSIASADNQCEDGKRSCPLGKTCCVVNGQYDCCDSEISGPMPTQVSSAFLNGPSQMSLHSQRPISGNTTVQHAFSWCDSSTCSGTCCSAYACCHSPNVKCCPGDTCCETGTTCCSGGCCPYLNGVCCSDNRCCPDSHTCCPSGCCTKRNAICCPDGGCCDRGTTCCDGVCCLNGGKCCGDWCCKSSQRCGVERNTCYNAGMVFTPAVMNLLGLVLISCTIKYRFL